MSEKTQNSTPEISIAATVNRTSKVIFALSSSLSVILLLLGLYEIIVASNYKEFNAPHKADGSAYSKLELTNDLTEMGNWLSQHKYERGTEDFDLVSKAFRKVDNDLDRWNQHDQKNKGLFGISNSDAAVLGGIMMICGFIIFGLGWVIRYISTGHTKIFLK